MSASQAIFRAVEAVTGPVNSSVPVPSVLPAPASAPSGAAPGQEVAIADGDHDLGAESAGGGQGPRGEGNLAAADEAVEKLLRLGRPPSVLRFPGRRRAGPGPVLR
ncbi:hypothetical protein QFZ65_003373 [Arthrobacter sp. B3I9]|uniref:hypothetical protein n=1 Tax=Arthrobacter sp. B3I9 TaxID=3042270 RepID=UPI00278D2E78|nr:hypothetical protein [Arthrobacter sp. B3I9]